MFLENYSPEDSNGKFRPEITSWSSLIALLMAEKYIGIISKNIVPRYLQIKIKTMDELTVE